MTFQFKTATAAAGISAALLAGWLIGGGWNSVIAQTRPPSPRSRTPVAVTRAPATANCFEIPFDVRLNGGPALLNKCTGDTWRFDSGGSGSAGEWVPVARD